MNKTELKKLLQITENQYLGIDTIDGSINSPDVRNIPKGFNPTVGGYLDLVYKVTNRNKEDFEHLTLDSVLTFEDSITCYRTITGACSFGTRDFVQSNGIVERDRTVLEIIELTKDSYGNDSFTEFFN